MAALKLIPQLVTWCALVLVLLRGFPQRRQLVAASACAGFAAGLLGFLTLSRGPAGTFAIEAVRSLLGVSFFAFWGVSVAALYLASGRSRSEISRPAGRVFPAVIFALFFGVTAGGVIACRLPAAGADSLLAAVAVLVVALALAAAALTAERRLPPSVTVSFPGLLAALVGLNLLAASFSIRLDLFSPLSMKVMKGFHDFVHQFMESVLIPDHLFMRPKVWGYIGLLFNKEVGFWGGMVIWFTPVLLVLLANRFEPLPAVTHIRQGAQRRRMLAAGMHARNLRLWIPCAALVVFSAAAYQSQFPTVEYWDPKPIPVTPDAAGEIFLPKKGEVELEDGKLHKFVVKLGGREARFFVLMNPNGKLTVDLDACAICKPDGYGQAEGTVICYYCKTLIPLETVGMPGGCNPVPVSFRAKEDGVHLDATALLNAWSQTVQATTGGKGGGK